MEFHVTPKAEAKCFPRFYLMSEEQGALSAAAGKPIYKDVEMVEVIIPGDSRTSPHFRVKDEHRFRWPDVYAAFKEGREAPMSGTPLSEWPNATPAWISNLHVMQVRTVEQLATLSDAQAQGMMGLLALRDRAKAWLATAEGQRPIDEALARAERAEAANADWERRYNDLTARVDAIQAKKEEVAE